MGACVLEKMSLKRPWSKLQMIKEILICMVQILWNNLHWDNFSSFQASAITHPGSSQVPQSCQVVEGGWQMLVERQMQDAPCHCSSWSSAMPEVRALLGQSRTRPLAEWLPCPAGLCQVASGLCWPGCCCPARMLPLPCVQDPGRLWGTARVWGLFSQSY